MYMEGLKKTKSLGDSRKLGTLWKETLKANRQRKMLLNGAINNTNRNLSQYGTLKT
jgi:hypothetical protein